MTVRFGTKLKNLAASTLNLTRGRVARTRNTSGKVAGQGQTQNSRDHPCNAFDFAPAYVMSEYPRTTQDLQESKSGDRENLQTPTRAQIRRLLPSDWRDSIGRATAGLRGQRISAKRDLTQQNEDETRHATASSEEP